MPTMDEQGFAGFDATTWYGLVGPAKLNPAFIKRVNEDMNKVMAMPDVIEKFDLYGAEDGGGSPERFAEFIRNETQKWAKVIKDATLSYMTKTMQKEELFLSWRLAKMLACCSEVFIHI
ncbi:MAG: hypothetical protein RL420_1596 [Pseudomonadota bacterium]